MRRLFKLVMLVVLGLVLLCSGWALAAQYPASKVMGLGTSLEGRDQADGGEDRELVGSGMAWPALKNPQLAPYFIKQIISDENWDEWRRFQRTTSTIIPVTAILFYRVYSVDLPVKTERDQTGLPEFKARKRDIEALKLLPEKFTLGGLKEGTAREGDPLVKGRPWTPTAWLFEGDGLLSPSPWASDNFVPRAFTIIGLLLGGILLVEVLRAVIRVGFRAFNTGRSRKV